MCINIKMFKHAIIGKSEDFIANRNFVECHASNFLSIDTIFIISRT